MNTRFLRRERDTVTPADHTGQPALGRRAFLQISAGTAVAVGAGWTVLSSATAASGAPATAHPYDNGPKRFIALAGTDGWVGMPPDAKPIPPLWPDGYAPNPQNLYVFGFRNITALHSSTPSSTSPSITYDVLANANLGDAKGHAQASAPLLVTQVGQDVILRLYNLGLKQRPDLFDSHTVHWHGFPNQVPYFDGVPDDSFSVPGGSDAYYRFQPTDPGTYMYHCHVEDAEHVQMGMQGSIFVLPADWSAGNKHAYGAGTDAAATATAYDREYAMHLDEFDVLAHFNDSHLQVSNWINYSPTFGVINGRAYPDTLQPSFDIDNFSASSVATDAPHLAAQPITAKVSCEPGEKVLVRFSNLGFLEHTMTSPGLPMRVVGVDGKFVAGTRDGYENQVMMSNSSRGDAGWSSNEVSMGPGEARDVIFDIPAGLDTSGGPVKFPLYDRDLGFTGDDGTSSDSQRGGMRTEIWVYPAGSLGTQAGPNDHDYYV